MRAGSRWHAAAYFNWFGGPRAWGIVKNSPGLEDFWQLHYQPQGGEQYNVPEQFIANVKDNNCPGYWLKLSAQADGSFKVTNSRTNFTKEYAADPRKASPAQSPGKRP